MKHADGVDELVHRDHVEAGGLEWLRGGAVPRFPFESVIHVTVSLRKCDFPRLLYLRKCDFPSLLPDQSGQLSSSQPEELGVRAHPCAQHECCLDYVCKGLHLLITKHGLEH